MWFKKSLCLGEVQRVDHRHVSHAPGPWARTCESCHPNHQTRDTCKRRLLHSPHLSHRWVFFFISFFPLPFITFTLSYSLRLSSLFFPGAQWKASQAGEPSQISSIQTHLQPTLHLPFSLIQGQNTFLAHITFVSDCFTACLCSCCLHKWPEWTYSNLNTVSLESIQTL